jgi:hypothetical protein
VTVRLPLRRHILVALILAFTLIGAFPRWHGAALAASAPKKLPSAGLAIGVDSTGLYRITGSQLKANGFSWNGVAASALTLTSAGKTVPMQVSGPSTLGDGSSIEFYGQAEKSQYTRRNVYILRAGHTTGSVAGTINGVPGSGSSPASYMSTFSEPKRTIYEPFVQGDPWMYTTITAIANKKKGQFIPEPVGQNVKISLPGLITSGQATLSVQVVGITALPDAVGPQHHMIVQVNGKTVAETSFSGYYTPKTITAKVPASDLTPTTTVRFQLPDDVQNNYDGDQMDVHTFTLKYPRALNAAAGHLTATLPAGKTVRVTGLHGTQVSVWRVGPGAPQVVAHASVRPSGSTDTVSFATPRAGTYIVSDAQSLRQPASISAQLSPSSLLKGTAQLLVIAPHAFTSAIAPLAAYHSQHGVTIKVASVESVYARFSSDVVDPNAIASYIKDAQSSLGTQYVLLVGGDTYDPLHYLHCTAKACPGNPTDDSYIPSLYTRDDYYGQIPSDELYAGGTAGPTVAIGRIPAITVEQVNVAVQKTLAVLQSGAGSHTAVFAAGDEEPDFEQTSQELAANLPSDYTVTDAYEHDNSSATAKSTLLTSIDAGTLLVNYVGHGNLEQWGNPPALLTVGEARKLSTGTPGVFLGWGCQTAYHIDPTELSLNVSLLFQPNSGAFLTLGSTGLDLPEPQAVLAKHLYAEIFGSTSTVSTIGDALRQAEVESLAESTSTIQPIESYELFGDPLLPTSLLK